MFCIFRGNRRLNGIRTQVSFVRNGHNKRPVFGKWKDKHSHLFPIREEGEWGELAEYPPVRKVYNYKELIESPTKLRKSDLRRVNWTVKSTAEPKDEKEDWTETPEYPAIRPLTHESLEEQRKEIYYRKIKDLKTVEEKLLALNLPRYYGWPLYLLKEGDIPYNFIPLVQYATRTVLHETEHLPVALSKEQYKPLLDKIKPQLEKVLVLENCTKRFKHEIDGRVQYLDLSNVEISDIKAKNIVDQVNRVMLNALGPEYYHLRTAQVDYEPRLEAFWRVGGFYPNKEDIKTRKHKKMPEERLEDLIDRCFQYIGHPVLQLRSRVPLEPLPERKKEVQVEVINENKVEPSDETSVAIKQDVKVSSDILYPLQTYQYDPSVYMKVPRERMPAVNTPGFWPNDPYQYGLLTYLTRGYTMERPSTFGVEDVKESLHCQAILSSYSSALAQANYHGFTIFNDITYPFVSQTIITDGRLFSFYTYQLNTIVLHSDNVEKNPLNNDCYGTLSQELYHEIRDNRIVGWNDKALMNLLSFYTNVPKKRENVDMTPYLGKERVLSHVKEEERRNWLHNIYRHIVSRRPRHRLPPEIYDWERIFKIEFNKRPLAPPHKFYELGQDPINDRKLSDHCRKYIPKVLRKPDMKKFKFEEVYYPDVYPEFIDVV